MFSCNRYRPSLSLLFKRSPPPSHPTPEPHQGGLSPHILMKRFFFRKLCNLFFFFKCKQKKGRRRLFMEKRFPVPAAGSTERLDAAAPGPAPGPAPGALQSGEPGLLLGGYK